MPHETDPRRRFSNRVADYVKFRPNYPAELLEYIRQVTGLDATWRIADVGSGTGKLTSRLLDGNTVFAVEPNPEMRSAAEHLLRGRDGFHSVAGSAENTTLANHTVRLVTAAQAFHWFDLAAARREFLRILEPDGWIVLVWNTRQTDATKFMQAYEDLLLQDGVDYTTVDHRLVDRNMLETFAGPFVERQISFVEWLDFEAVRGRTQSASYVPAPGTPGHGAIVERLRAVFDETHEDGRVAFVYNTEAFFFGPLNPTKS